MKALSVKNPWGYLICVGIKDVENRTWATDYRGKILIHTSKKWDADYFFDDLQIDNLSKDIHEKVINRDIPCGAIIGEAELFGITQSSASIWAVYGQYHWILRNQVLYEEPIPAKGSLGLWEYER